MVSKLLESLKRMNYKTLESCWQPGMKLNILIQWHYQSPDTIFSSLNYHKQGEIRKPSLVINAKKKKKKQKKTIEWEKLEISSRKSEMSREDFMQRWAQ